MCKWLYTLRERFTPESVERWNSYVAFSGFEHIAELVTLDSMMCPDVITDLLDADWSHNVHADFRTTLFHDLGYLVSRESLNAARHQVLAIVERPDGTESSPSNFTRCGFDIMDSCFGNSTLTNCGQIPEAFTPSMVNEFGLLSDGEAAIEVRDRMRAMHPDDPHLGECDVWFIARTLPVG